MYVELEDAYGDGIIQVTESEKIIRNKLRGWWILTIKQF